MFAALLFFTDALNIYANILYYSELLQVAHILPFNIRRNDYNNGSNTLYLYVHTLWLFTCIQANITWDYTIIYNEKTWQLVWINTWQLFTWSSITLHYSSECTLCQAIWIIKQAWNMVQTGEMEYTYIIDEKIYYCKLP